MGRSGDNIKSCLLSHLRKKRIARNIMGIMGESFPVRLSALRSDALSNIVSRRHGPPQSISEFNRQNTGVSHTDTNTKGSSAISSNGVTHNYNSDLAFYYVDHIGIYSLVMGIVIGILLAITFTSFQKIQSKEANKKMINREVLAHLRSLTEPEIQKLFGAFPGWLAVQDLENAGWINKVVAAAWPYLDEATSNVIRKSLDPILQSTRPTFLTTLQFERFSFGSVPAKIKAVKVYETEDEGALEIDIKVFWAGDPDVVLGIRAAQDTLNVPVSLTELQCSFTLRLIFAPLIGVFPCFGALTIALMDDPQLQFDLRVVGGDITVLPGLSQRLRSYITALIASYLVWPRSITVPIPGTGYSLPATNKSRRKSVLKVTILSFENFPKIPGNLMLEVNWPTFSSKAESEQKNLKIIEGKIGDKRKLRFAVEDPERQLLCIRWYEESESFGPDSYTASKGIVTSEASVVLADLFCKEYGSSKMLESEIIVGVQLQSTNLDTRSTSVKVREAQSGNSRPTVFNQNSWNMLRKSIVKRWNRNTVSTQNDINDKSRETGVNAESQRRTTSFQVIQLGLSYDSCDDVE